VKSATETKETTMRKITLVFASILAVSSALLPKVTAAQSAMVNGQVTKIDESAGKITLKHGPIKKLDMEDTMTMVFRVQDPAMLKQVKVGDKIRFDADRVNGQFTVTKIEKAR
jgi:Cu/Ag efflux protein CusF